MRTPVRVCLSVNHRNSSGSCKYPLPATSWWFSSCCLVHIAGARSRSHTTLHQRCRHDSPSPGSNVSQTPSTLTLLQLDQPHAPCAHGPSPRSSPPQALATSSHGASLHPGAMCNPQCLPCRPVQERPTCAFHAAPMDQCVTIAGFCDSKPPTLWPALSNPVRSPSPSNPESNSDERSKTPMKSRFLRHGLSILHSTISLNCDLHQASLNPTAPLTLTLALS